MFDGFGDIGLRVDVAQALSGFREDPLLRVLRRQLVQEQCRLVLSEDEGDPAVIDELKARIGARKAELARAAQREAA